MGSLLFSLHNGTYVIEVSDARFLITLEFTLERLDFLVEEVSQLNLIVLEMLDAASQQIGHIFHIELVEMQLSEGEITKVRKY